MEPSRQSAFELGTDGPRSILVGIDGSESSMRAGAYAAGLARRQHSRLTVVYARPAAAGAILGFDQDGSLTLAQLQHCDAVEGELREGLRRYMWQLHVSVEVRNGRPLQVITETADDVRAEAVVIGSSRPGAILRTAVALSTQLIHTRKWPVIVVP